MVKQLLAGTAAMAVLVATPATAQNLITNGSFEGQAGSYNAVAGGDGTTVTGWTGVANGFEWFKPVQEYGLGPAHSGLSVVDLALGRPDATMGGGLYQDVATVAGRRYTLSFYGVNSTFAGRSGTGQADIFAGGTSLSSATITNIAPSWTAADWQLFARTFTATGGTTRIQFSNNQNENTNFAFIDDVAVTAVPEPATWAMMIMGFGLVGGAARYRRRATRVAVAG